MQYLSFQRYTKRYGYTCAIKSVSSYMYAYEFYNNVDVVTKTDVVGGQETV